jgi:hypothetical protein
MPSGNLNSGCSHDTDDLKVRPLKVNAAWVVSDIQMRTAKPT